MPQHWIADRTQAFDSSGIRKVFDLASQMKTRSTCRSASPTSTCPKQVREACIDAIQKRQERLRPDPGHAGAAGEAAEREVDAAVRPRGPPGVRLLRHQRRAWCWPCLSLVNPGDEVIIFDPYFVMYESLVSWWAARRC